ncbi:MAG: flagellar hook-basal body complex protein [Sphingobium sp.]
MSFYISLSGLKGAQSDLATISNNVANVSSTAFKKSRANFGDIFVGAANGTGQGVRLLGSQQQFTQGTLETTDKTLDLAITGEGFFTVRTPDGATSYTRNGAFSMDENRYVLDTTGSRLQVLPTAPDGNGAPTSTDPAALTDLVVPTTKPGDATVELSSIGIGETGVVTATYADGTTQKLGVVAMAAFASQEGLRQIGDAHWTATGNSGEARYAAGKTGTLGAIRSGTLERSNVEVTEELVALISAQRNFQANAKAIEAASTLTQTITNLRT